MISVRKIWKTGSYGFPLTSSPRTKFRSPAESVLRSTTAPPQCLPAGRTFGVFMIPFYSSVIPITVSSTNVSQLCRTGYSCKGYSSIDQLHRVNSVPIQVQTFMCEL